MRRTILTIRRTFVRATFAGAAALALMAGMPAPAQEGGVDIRALLADPAVKNHVGMVENHWDFNAPETIPGFGPITPAAK